jgi:hypothetical protein
MNVPVVHPAALPVEALLADCRIERTRRSGPGGQHRNKVETAVVITHQPTGQRAEASERRRQAENHAVAVFRLRLQLALHVRTERPDPPSDIWRSRLHNGRLSINPSHDDFPAILAEALDVLAMHDHDPRPAADHLTCTPSQLVRLLKLEPAALELVNTERTRRNLHALH